MKKSRKIFGYVLYCIVLTLVLLYYRFPSGFLTDYLETKIDKAAPAFLVSIGQVSPTLPFGLKFTQTEVSLKTDPKSSFLKAESLFIRPALWSFLRGKFQCCFDCAAYNGDLKGCVRFAKNSVKAPFTSSMDLSDIRIGDCAYISTLLRHNIKGILSGNIKYSGQYNLLLNGTAEANLKVSDGRIEFSSTILSLDAIDFNVLLIKAVMKRRRLDLRRVELKGQEIQGTLSGSISLRRNLLKSGLHLRGSIEPLDGFTKNAKGAFGRKRRLTFIIHGTIGEPKIKLI